MFGKSRIRAETLQEVSGALEGLEEAVREGLATLAASLQSNERADLLEARLQKLEGELATREAKAAAELLEAKSRYDNARAAEERARAHRKKAEEAVLDAGDEDGADGVPQEYLDLLPNSDAAPSGPDGMSTLQRVLARGGRPTREEMMQIKLERFGG